MTLLIRFTNLHKKPNIEEQKKLSIKTNLDLTSQDKTISNLFSLDVTLRNLTVQS